MDERTNDNFEKKKSSKRVKRVNIFLLLYYGLRSSNGGTINRFSLLLRSSGIPKTNSFMYRGYTIVER